MMEEMQEAKKVMKPEEAEVWFLLEGWGSGSNLRHALEWAEKPVEAHVSRRHSRNPGSEGLRRVQESSFKMSRREGRLEAACGTHFE